jgi:polyribonucleotide nucleotidyltransferase
MNKQEILNLYRALNGLGNLSGAKFAYAVAKNINLIKSEIEALEKASTPSDEFKKFDEARVKLAEEFAKKDKDGKAETKDNAYVIEDQKAFDKAFEKLRKEYKETVEARETQMKQFSELLKEESTVELYALKSLDEVPKEITAAQMFILMPIMPAQ